MDAQIATIIASYLPLYHSNVFVSLIDLTEHIISPTQILTVSHQRQLEIIRALKYPLELIQLTDNYDAAIEFIHTNPLNMTDMYEMIMFMTDFDRLGNYVHDYPNGVAKVTSINCKGFRKHIEDVGVDMRYVDFLSIQRGTVIESYIFHPDFPEWSLNQHLRDSSLDNIIDIIARVRADPDRYSTYINTFGCYVTYCFGASYRDSHDRIFADYYVNVIDDTDSLLRLLRATFDDATEARKWIAQYNIRLTKVVRAKLVSAIKCM